MWATVLLIFLTLSVILIAASRVNSKLAMFYLILYILAFLSILYFLEVVWKS